ncbi:MAG: FN3 associated domain-containing protein [Sedimentisphaerales bacterium]
MTANYRKFGFFLFVITGVLAGFACAASCPPADLDGNCRVDLNDLAIFTQQWLSGGDCEGSVVCADFDGVNGINFVDFSILANSWRKQGIPLAINEFVASNNSASGFHDPNGDYDDWIEIYNFGDAPVNLAGMYLSDKPDNPTKWHVPSGYSSQTTAPAYGFVVFWADEEPNQGPLHANIKLSADGEDILLSDSNGVLIDSISFGPQTANISYQRYPDAKNNWQFCSSPTPGAHNNSSYIGEVNQVNFSSTRGFYSSSFNLTLTCTTPGAAIYYTTDGSAPVIGEVNTPKSIRYTAPIAISSTKCVQAAATKTGYRPAESVTHTYIFGASATIQAMPLISIVGDSGNSLYEPNGVMAIVGGSYVNGVWTSGGAGTYNNPLQRGLERAVSLEIIDPTTSTNLQVNCGIRVHGSDYTRPRYTRGTDWNTCYNGWPNWNSNKFSFNMYFRSDYGSATWLDYPFFPLTPEVTRFGAIVLRAGHNDSCTPFVKDEWMRRLFKEMGGVQETGVFANIYINGQYKSYFNPTGHADNDFYKEWYNTSNDFDVITQGGVRDGDNTAFNNLVNYAASNNLSITTYYNYVADRFDITQFVDYLVLQIYSSNFDWPGNNWTAHRERSDTAKFRFSVWDAEGIETWVAENHMDVNAFEDLPTWTSPTGLNHLSWDPISILYRALKANPEFKQLFADRLHKHFRNGGLLTKNHLTAKWWEVFGEVSAVLPYTGYPANFIPNTFIPKREDPILGVFEQQGLWTRSFGAPVFNVNGVYKFGGTVSPTDVFTITDPCSSGGTIYYAIDGNDPRTPFTGTISSSAITYSGGFSLSQNADLKARIYKSSTQKWSPLNEAFYQVQNP